MPRFAGVDIPRNKVIGESALQQLRISLLLVESTKTHVQTT